MRRRHVVAAAVAAAAIGAGSYQLARSPAHYQHPNRTLTPGTTDLNVTQANIGSTICVPGYSKTVRPPASVTDGWKLTSMQEYHRTGPPSAYEYDHLIPIEDGGAPDQQANLWPQPLVEAKVKDRDENQAHRDICSGAKTLRQAQRDLLKKWG